ncbi:MAG: cob(I)yrinic acid a,c-diamide adenosyltransferase [Nanoarchaeota archaeon]|nr:cob(I)yrinic acid a,c-diamide adenosyltransferase [Nanoarchaeota archaeon]
MKLKKGFIHIYTGNGRGKTSVAIGTALRATKYGLKVCFIHFMKGALEKALENENINHKFFGRKEFVYKDKIQEEDKKIAQQGIKFAEQILDKYDVVILDEVILAAWFNLISEKDILNLIEKKPENVELILTGRNASKKLIEKADYVSEIKKVKHPYDKGVLAREGIDY